MAMGARAAGRLTARPVHRYLPGRALDPLPVPRAMPRLLIVAALLTLAACASAAGTPGAGTPSLAGAYRLAEIDGHALPTASPTESRITIAEGTLQLRDGSYVLALNAGAVDGTPFWRTLHGRYADSGG